MLESFKGKQFTYTPLSKEDMEKRGILGRLVGPIADTKSPTRNGRTYSKELWENVFNDPLMQEKIKNRCLFQELGHPEDRTEVDMEKICACLAETPKVGEDGLLYGVFDILPTKNGQLLKVLCDYGTTIGVSSRGTGDIIDNGDGEEVDPSTYDCETWDFVIVPAVEKARLSYVTESLDSGDREKMLNLKKALTEELDKANPEERKAMQETLQSLNIDLGEQDAPNSPDAGVEDKSTSESESKDSETKKAEEASNDGSEALIKGFQEALMKSAELEQRVRSLQEQLAVSDAEVTRLKGESERHKSTIVNLTKQVRESKEGSNSSISALEESIKGKDAEIAKLEGKVKELQGQSERAKRLRESMAIRRGEAKKLQESVNDCRKTIAELNEKLTSERRSSESRIKGLTEEASSSKRLAEGYKKLANRSVDKYIELKAVMLGIDPQAIKNSLKEQFTLQDVDDVCDNLQGQEINLSRLPFRVGRNTVVKVNESRQAKVSTSRQDIYDDDYVDDTLLKVAGVIK